MLAPADRTLVGGLAELAEFVEDAELAELFELAELLALVALVESARASVVQPTPVSEAQQAKTNNRRKYGVE